MSQVNTACTPNPVVIDNADSGPGTLREALTDACSTAGSNTITFDMDPAHAQHVVTPIALNAGELSADRNVNIVGPGASVLTVTRAGGEFRIFQVGAGRTVTISGLTISNGLLGPGGNYNFYGAGIFNQGTLTLNGVVLSNHRSFETGGAIYNTTLGSGSASLTIVNSTIRDSQATNGSGGIQNDASTGGTATVLIQNSTISGNIGGNGGAVYNDGGTGQATVTIVNSTVSGNQADNDGGGLYNNGDGNDAVTLVNATITNNQSNRAGLGTDLAGGIRTTGGTVTLRNTIVALNTQHSTSGPDTADDIRGDLDPASASNLIGDGSNMTGVSDETNGNQVGTSGSPIDPKLGPLANNGGPTLTHALLRGSPAIDTGDNSFVVAPPFVSASPITDQRGPGTVRIADSDDLNATATVDIGALEAQPTIEDITDKSTGEDTPLSFSFNVGDGTVGFDSQTATSSDQAVVADAGLSVTGSGSTRTLLITPAANASGTTTITVTLSKTIGGTAVTATDTFLLTVTSVNDAPTLTAIGNPAAILEDAGLQTVNLAGISAGGGESQALTITAVSDNTALIPNPSVTYTSPNATGSLTYTPVANASGSAVITVTVQDAGGTANGGVDTTVRTFTVAVTAVADTPGVTGATTAEDTQTPNGSLVISRSAVDGVEVTHVKITNIQHGTLYLHDGVTAIPANSFITVAQAGAGLKFTPAANYFGLAGFDVQASVSNVNAGLGGSVVTAPITVTAVADPPQVTSASTLAQVQTTSGLIVTPNAVDGPEVTHFKISSIANGTVFLSDGTTPVGEGMFITLAQATAGLRFTPANGFSGTATFLIQGATDNLGGGLSSATTATITVSKHTTITTLTSADPNPSDRTQPITVTYSVASADGGPAPSPASTVTVSYNGGAETCTGTVAAGSCTLTPTAAGSWQILAHYNGDAINTGGNSSTLAHTVNGCTTDPVVVNTNPSGAGSLVDAVATACFGNTVTFSIPGPGPHTITLNNFTLDIAKDLTIRGASDGTRISAGNLTPILLVEVNVNAVLDGLTLTNGSSDFGGALTNYGTLAIRNSTLSGNTATSGGGAILNSGALTLINSTISGNTAQTGGGIFHSGTTLSLINATVTANTATTSGGGLVSLTTGSSAVNTILTGNTSADNLDVAGGQPLTDGGHNLLTGNPLLGPLQNNGGPTFTHMPLPAAPRSTPATTSPL